MRLRQDFSINVLLVVVLVVTTLFFGFLASQVMPSRLLAGLALLLLLFVAFMSPSKALYILIFSMLLSPEFIVGGAGGGAALGRGVTVRLDDIFLIVIGFGWFARAAIYKELGLFLRTPLNRPIFYYLLACLTSTGFGILAGRVDPTTGFFFTLKYFEYFIVYFMAVNYIHDEKHIRRLIFCLFLTAGIISLIGIYQIPGGGRVTAPFEGEAGEPNTLGGYLLFIGALAAGIFSKTESQRAGLALGSLIALLLPPFLFTESRSSYLAFIPTYLALTFLGEKKVLMVGALTIAIALSPLYLPQKVKERVLFTFRQPQESGQLLVAGVRVDTSTSERLKSWMDAIKDWPRHPLLGYGITGYAFMDAQFARVLVETGVAGLTGFLYLLYCIFKISLIRYRRLKDPYFKGITCGFLAGYVGLLFHAIGANTFIIVRIMEPFWFVAAIVVMLPTVETLTGEYSTQ